MSAIAIITGYVGQDAELRYTPSGVPVASFSVAVRRRVGQEERTDWYRVSAWQKRGEFSAEYVKKGTLLQVQGRLERREYTAANGATVRDVEVVAENLELLGRRPGGDPVAAPAPVVEPLDVVEEVPF